MFRASIMVVILVSGVTAAAGQTPAAPTVPPFVLESDNGDNRVQLAGLAQMDGRFAPESVSDTFLIRRARISLQGRVARYFEFFIQPEFAGGSPSLFDAYLDVRFSNAFRIRTGKAKVPFGLERLVSAANLLFVERAYPTALVPNRDVGVQVLGDLWDGTLSYGAALTNGVVDGGSGDIDANEGKDLAARVFVRPLARSRGHPLNGFGAGVAGSVGDQPAALPTVRTSAQQPFFSFAAGAVGEGRRVRVSPQMSYYGGPFGAFAEYARSTGDVRLGGTVSELTNHAWQVAGSWVVTGEAASDRGVRPRASFDPANGAWGALQLAARYSVVTLDDAASAFAAQASNRQAATFTAGVNWYANAYVRWMLNVERTVFRGPVTVGRPDEHAILLRSQIAF